MITKIVIIAMGLVAVVPHGDNDGATVLLRDALLSTPSARLVDGTNCPVDLHLPLVMQVVGKCTGECLNVNAPSTLAARILPALAPAAAAVSTTVEGEQTGIGEGRLLWLPLQQSLSFDHVTPTKEPAHNFDLAFRLGDGAAKVDADCLGNAERCPIVGRFTADEGSVKACTLSQREGKDGKYTNAGFVIDALEEEVTTTTVGDALAETYAIEITTNRRAPLVLSATNFSGSRLLREVALYPNEKGEIVLVVMNLSSRDHHEVEGCKDLEGGAAHSAVVYDLAQGRWGSAARLVPHLVDTASRRTPLGGGCGAYLDLLKGLLPDFVDYPSDPARCKPGGLIME